MPADTMRLPGVVIIGAMKSATTSIYRWLDEQPEVFMAHPKETNYFTDAWSKGLEWYASQFDEATSGQLIGEASVAYTDPDLSPAAARRMRDVIPQARLIYVLRHPVDRIRSHYRHELQRHREGRSLLDALRQPGNSYLRHSCYATALQPYLDHFPADQILVLRFEDLVAPPSPGWSRSLEFLGLADRPVPEEAHNVGAEKTGWTWAMSWAKRHRLISLGQISRLPTPIRKVGKRVFTRGGDAYTRRLDASRAPIPLELLEPMWRDVARLEATLGMVLWSPEDEATAKAAG